MSSLLWKVSATVACVLAAFSLNANVVNAQECGDADGSGSVTVTDGVQALRAAAALSSSCGATCDVDGSGFITVTDGVNILRKAAGIAIAEACVGLNAQVQELLQNTLPIFGTLTKGAGAQAAGTSFCENAEGEVFFDTEFNELTFVECAIGGILFDGVVGLDDSTNTIFFDIDFTDIATDEFFSFFGDLTERVSGENSILTGSLDVSFSELGDLTIAFEEVVSDPNGNFVGGSLLFDASDAEIENVAGIRVGFTTATAVPVSVILTDQSTIDFTFDLNSGILTPVS